MDSMLEQTKETHQLFVDIDEGRIPKRVPVHTWLDISYVIQYAGMDMRRANWDVENFGEL